MTYPVKSITPLPVGYDTGLELAYEISQVNPDIEKIMGLFADNATFSVQTYASKDMLTKEQFKDKLMELTALVTKITDWIDKFTTARTNDDVFVWKGHGYKYLEKFDHQKMPDGSLNPLSSWFQQTETLKCLFTTVNGQSKITSCCYKVRREHIYSYKCDMSAELSLYRRSLFNYLRQIPRIEAMIRDIADDTEVLLADGMAVNKWQYGELMKLETANNRERIGPFSVCYMDEEEGGDVIIVKGYELRNGKVSDESGRGWYKIIHCTELTGSVQMHNLKEHKYIKEKVLSSS